LNNSVPSTKAMLLAGVLVSSIVFSLAGAQTSAPAGKPAVAVAPSRYQPSRFPAKELGQIEGTLDFCSQLNPKAATKYRERGRALMGNTSEKNLIKARSFGEYRESYNWIDSELRKVSKDDAAKACTNFVEAKAD
jgi:hypothetical protein